MSQREETLLDLSIYIAQSGNVQEAYETLQRYVQFILLRLYNYTLNNYYASVCASEVVCLCVCLSV